MKKAVILILMVMVCNCSGNGSSKQNNSAPNAQMVVSVESGYAPLVVEFDASGSSDEDGVISSYYWNFGDGETGSGASIAHTFQTGGTYTVVLTVTDNKGKTGTASRVIDVKALLTGQALLGPLTSAEVKVYHQDDLKVPIYTTLTSESEKLSQAGFFNIPETVVEDGAIYVITISGGSDIDADDNGVIDDIPTDNLGTLHMIATTAQLKSGDFRANILTDIIYHQVSYLIFAQYPEETIRNELDQYAETLLSADVDGDGDRDYHDILRWHPALNKGRAARSWWFLKNCIAAIHDNVPYTYFLSQVYRGNRSAVDLPGKSYAITVSGNFAYLSIHNGITGIQVMDISNPDSPAVLGTLDMTWWPKDLVVSGDYAYAVNGWWEFFVIDIKNPDNPSIVATIDITPHNDSVDAITVSGDYTYVLADGLQIIDISDPTTPAVIGTMDIDRYESEIAVSGGYAYILSRGLKVIDISDPTSPVTIGTFTSEIMDDASDIALSGNFAYVLIDDQSILLAVDISDPTNPVVAGFVDAPSGALCILESGDYAYIAGESSPNIWVIDIDNMFNPAIIGALYLDFNRFEISGNYVYTIGNESYIIDIFNPAGPVIAGRFDDRIDEQIIDMTVSGNYAYSLNNYSYCWEGSSWGLEPGCNSYYYFRTIDISDPSNPQSIAEFSLSELPRQVSVSDSYAYVAMDNRLEMFDIHDPSNPTSYDSIILPGEVFEFTIAGDYIFGSVSSSYFDLQIIDIKDPANPVIVGNIEELQEANSFTVSGDYVYITAEMNGVYIVDVSNPAIPNLVSTVDTPYFASDISISGNYAYVGNGNSSYGGVVNKRSDIQIVDISNPPEESIVTNLVTQGDVHQLAVPGGYVYVRHSVGLFVYKTIPE